MKRTVFRNRWLPYALVAPQLAVTVVFFFWPAFDSLRLSLYRASPFGDRMIFIGAANFERLLSDPAYFRSVATSFLFSALLHQLPDLIAFSIMKSVKVVTLPNEQAHSLIKFANTIKFCRRKTMLKLNLN